MVKITVVKIRANMKKFQNNTISLVIFTNNKKLSSFPGGVFVCLPRRVSEL
jgi:hypothetical protein